MADPPHILRLPPELVLRVSSHLTTEQLGAFRRTCKYVETSLFDSFAREFFTKRQFMIEEVSLDALVGIANHKTLAPYLSEVLIGLDRIHDEAWRTRRALASDQEAESWPVDSVNRTTWLETGRARDLLVDAFAKLPNLRTASLRDYDGFGRWRDGQNARWRSYGWSLGLSNEQRQEFSERSRTTHPYPGDIASTNVLSLLLYALGLSGAKLTNFDVILRRDKLPHIAFDILKGFLRPTIAPVLSGLRRLLLSVSRESTHDTLHNGEEWLPLPRFLEHTTNLQHLRLNFESESYFPEAVLNWLDGTASAAKTLSDTKPLANLTTLELGMLRASSQTLLRLACRFNLKSFTLWKVAIHCNDTAELDGDPNPWKTFLQDLSKALPSPKGMKSLSIGNPALAVYMPSNYGQPYTPIGFLRQGRTPKDAEDDPENLEFTVTYHQHFGSDVRPWLDDIALRAFHKPKPDLSSVEEDGTSDHDSDEDGSDFSGEEEGDVDANSDGSAQIES